MAPGHYISPTRSNCAPYQRRNADTEVTSTYYPLSSRWITESYDASLQVADAWVYKDHHQPPPQLVRQTLIPLPPLADVPILIHPLIAYSRSAPPIGYDLSMAPSNASLSPLIMTETNERLWRHQPAMEPRTVGSITIRAPRLDRPIVVFPATLHTNVVMVENVLDAVYSSIRAQCTADLYRPGNNTALAMRRRTLNEDRYSRSRTPSSVDDPLTKAIRRYLGGYCIWAGLYPSSDERDVWILHTRREDNW
ncbi:hypothetical protein BDZ97DRAFT_1858870 [Flammula alnicola]|nr:hypothetical protein BDZ97DRAFT_1858870 [Flammula alnicola]